MHSALGHISVFRLRTMKRPFGAGLQLPMTVIRYESMKYSFSLVQNNDLNGEDITCLVNSYRNRPADH